MHVKDAQWLSGADTGCTEAGHQGQPRPHAHLWETEAVVQTGVLSARSSVQRLMCHRQWQRRDLFHCLSPCRVQQSPLRGRISLSRDGVCLPSQCDAVTSPVRCFSGCPIANLKARRKQFLVIKVFHVFI